MKVFLSYNRADAAAAASIASDLEGLGHDIWYDTEISGGQSWWDAILGHIRECDLFILLMTTKSLNSEACRAEYSYAAALQKRVLPVLCSTDVRINLLPPELSKVQFVNYCAQDKRAAFALVKALQGLPPAAPLPAQLPAEPPIPQSYLGGLRVQIESRQRLDRAQQSTLLIQIGERLNDPEMRDDALELLRLLRNRDDLLAAIDRGIEELLEDAPKPVRVPEEKPKRIPKTPPLSPESKTQGDPPAPAPPPLPKPPPLPNDSAVAARKLQLTKTAVGAVVQEVISNGETLMMQVAEDSVTLSIAEDQLAVVGSFQRWTPKELKLLQGRGWESGNRAMQGLAAGAIGVIGAATWGLGLGVLLHKGAREYVCSNVVSKRFAFDELEDAVAAVRDVWQVLAPGAREVELRPAPPPPLPS